MSTGPRRTIVPSVIDALYNMFAAAAPSANYRLPKLSSDGSAQQVAVVDGEPVSDVPPTYVLVGYSAQFAAAAFSGTSGLAIEGRRVDTELSNRQKGETFTIWCEVSSWSGDADPKAPSRIRAAVGDIYAACVGAIDDDPTLQGTVPLPAFAQATVFRWLFDQSPEGFAATVQFAVELQGEALVPA